MELLNNLFVNISLWLQGLLASFLPVWAAQVVMSLLVIVVILGLGVGLVMVFTYMERKIIARIQDRIGPNRWGPVGVLQPIADTLKLLLKEDTTPAGADRLGFLLGPLLVVVPALLVSSLIPFGDGMVGTDLNVGILFMVAISSVTTIAILTAGWASNNKYALLSALRVAAQMVSYEVPMVLSILGVVLLTSSLSMVSIVGAQEQVWFVFAQPIAFLIFFICALAEVNRSPFDIPEAESEIVAGFHIEYSGIKFAMFFLAEYINTFVVSAIVVSLFLGGWQGPILPPYVWFFLKVFSVVFVIMWIRGTLPRLRVDQFMSFAWKFLVPLALANVLVTGLVLGIVGPYLNDPYLSALALLVANGVMAAVVLAILFVSNRKAKERRLRERVA